MTDHEVIAHPSRWHWLGSNVIVIAYRFYFRRDIGGFGKSLHYACCYDKLEIAEFLIEEDKKIREQEGGQEGQIPLYNLKDRRGRSTLFFAKSSTIVELLLKYDDIEVSRENGYSLLWHCADKGILTETIATDERLRCQYGQKYAGKLPLEQGEWVGNKWSKH